MADKGDNVLLFIVLSTAYNLSFVRVAVHKIKFCATAISFIWDNKVLISEVNEIFIALSFEKIKQKDILKNLRQVNYLD